jgi:hypothetical protein
VGGEAVCCRGLQLVEYPAGQFICVECGDDVCSPGENLQNCPKDCRVPCVKAGEQVIGEAKCCRGLQSVEYPIGQFTCLKCGDDVCSPGETPEDCPKDCSAAQGT